MLVFLTCLVPNQYQGYPASLRGQWQGGQCYGKDEVWAGPTTAVLMGQPCSEKMEIWSNRNCVV